MHKSTGVGFHLLFKPFYSDIVIMNNGNKFISLKVLRSRLIFLGDKSS